jgi:hypothetical protein
VSEDSPDATELRAARGREIGASNESEAAAARPASAEFQGEVALNQGAAQRNQKGARHDLRPIARGSPNHQIKSRRDIGAPD